jgi:hypothetical protein
MPQPHPITAWLTRRNSIIQTIFISLIAFLTYACMYGIRKPFTVGSFEGLTFGGMDYKALLIISPKFHWCFSALFRLRTTLYFYSLTACRWE